MANVLALRIKERRGPARLRTGPAPERLKTCSWLEEAGEWTVADLTLTRGELATFMDRTKYPQFYYAGSRRVAYAFWHAIGFALCELTSGSIVADVGAAMGVWGRIARREFGCTVWDVDARYRPGIHGTRVGARAGEIPLPSSSASHVVSFCAFNCFEGWADAQFLHEAFRLLVPGGTLAIVPLCIGDEHVNLFDPLLCPRADAFDPGALRLPWQGWGNRFGRWYDRKAFWQRLIASGPPYERTILRVRCDAPLPDGVQGCYAALFRKPLA
jgi:SAM-dependent methyltransferase